MNKQEFLDDLNARTWCGALAGESVLAERKPDGTGWYIQNIRDESANVCVYRNIHFYVVDEGLPTERVFEKDTIAKSNIAKPETPFTDKVTEYVKASGDIILEETHEDSKVALIRFFNGDVISVTEKRYLVNEDITGKLRKIEII